VATKCGERRREGGGRSSSPLRGALTRRMDTSIEKNPYDCYDFFPRRQFREEWLSAPTKVGEKKLSGALNKASKRGDFFDMPELLRATLSGRLPSTQRKRPAWGGPNKKGLSMGRRAQVEATVTSDGRG